nr:PI-PLC X domain-containing protein At5g67130 [Tanacetum cinerariifolium]
MFQQHQGESLSEAWTHFKDLLQKVPHHGINMWLQIQIFYDHVNPITRRTIDQVADGKLRDKNDEESWALLEDLALYDNESWNDPRDFAKPVKAISMPHDAPSASDLKRKKESRNTTPREHKGLICKVDNEVGSNKLEEEEDDDLEYFNTFLSMKELEYHEWLLKNPSPPWVRAKIRTKNLNNIKISCMIGHNLEKQVYIDFESSINVMSRSCESDGDCAAGLYCFSCPQGYPGSKCVRFTATPVFHLMSGRLLSFFFFFFFFFLMAINNVASACSNGTCKLLDSCESDGDCETGLYCFSCPQGYPGSKCVRFTATPIFNLMNNSLPFNKYSFLTTHNAFPIDDGTPRVAPTNQEDTVTQQLNV